MTNGQPNTTDLGHIPRDQWDHFQRLSEEHHWRQQKEIERLRARIEELERGMQPDGRSVMDNQTTSRDVLFHAGGVLGIIVAFFIGVVFLIAACTDYSDPQIKLRQFVIGGVSVFGALAAAMVLYGREN